MRSLICAIMLGGLVSAGVAVPAPAKSGPPNSVSIDDVLRAHNAPRDVRDLSHWAADAIRLTRSTSAADGDVPEVFGRKISVSVTGERFRREKRDWSGVRQEIDVFDGREARHSAFEGGALVAKETETNSPHSRGLQFAVRTFGLIPSLKQLADPAVSAVYDGRTNASLDKFEVRNGAATWTLYADSAHLIRRVEIGSSAIEFADYRSVDGAVLPFFESVSIGGHPTYQFVFTRITLELSAPSAGVGAKTIAG